MIISPFFLNYFLVHQSLWDWVEIELEGLNPTTRIIKQ